jgi:ATP-dependent RNA helicase DeaD
MPATFAELGVDPPLLKAVEELGFEEPTPVQEQAIPLLLRGADIIAQAQTGTGKTAAYALPIIQRLETGARQPQALVLAPTRELAVQVAEATFKMGKYKHVSIVPVYGGQPIERQLRALRQGVHIVVGTPGRIMDHMRRGTLALDGVRAIILDEADEMLDMGFIEDIEWILQQAPAERQTALFSATIPPRIAELAKRYLRDPIRVAIPAETLTVPLIRQTYYEVVGQRKIDALTRILDFEEPASTILFVRTKRDADEVSESLQSRGYSAEALHGDMSQAQRERTLARFKRGQVEILVATDVAARGLDIEDVSHVINYDVPYDPESYVHRIGRTGRAGRAGDAVTLVTPRDRRMLRIIERLIGKRITPMRLPTLADVAARRREAYKESIRELLESGQNLDVYLELVEDLCEEYDAAEVAAAAFALSLQRQAAEQAAPEAVHSVDGDGAGTEPGMVRLFLNAGRVDRVRPADIVGAIANETNLPGRAIGVIDIYDEFSFVEVPREAANRVVSALSRTTLRGKRLNVEIARPQQRT